MNSSDGFDSFGYEWRLCSAARIIFRSPQSLRAKESFRRDFEQLQSAFQCVFREGLVELVGDATIHSSETSRSARSSLKPKDNLLSEGLNYLAGVLLTRRRVCDLLWRHAIWFPQRFLWKLRWLSSRNNLICAFSFHGDKSTEQRPWRLLFPEEFWFKFFCRLKLWRSLERVRKKIYFTGNSVTCLSFPPPS